MDSGVTFADNSRENHRWGDSSKVYTRRKLKDDTTSAGAGAGINSLRQHQTPSLVSRVKNRVRINLENLFPKDDVRILKRKLICELDQIRNLLNQIEAKEKIQLSVSVVENKELFEKEKRTPKANQYYSSEFLLAKDRLPPERNSKSKSSIRGKKHNNRNDHTNRSSLKSCHNLLAKLSKHKYGWVFGKPVDVKALGLHDYHDIIKQPMDLGTIKNKLARNLYKSPLEFAEDVRLTFSNAMTYNPKGQDVHVMAEELLKIFEAELEVLLLRYSRTFDRPELIKRSASIGKAPAPKRPKAKDLNKRDMTYEEKQKLSTKLQGLPVDKLDGIVQIIKKRNTQLSQHDDEIEVDIDSVDAETLWELDRFVTNYKKNLSKHRRRDQAKADPTKASIADVADTAGETNIVASGVVVPQGDNVDRSSRSSSESSSSRDSDSDSSSDGSDERRELKANLNIDAILD
ncbi:transcription factor GTE4-like [Impatiens glandulifera]|uniref:transcription factor GTE4-like n=1 Tax=Impatiens glandulifera TaxID=253017 RepID=UPI001FB118C8|nr:transcription factor GTE4-like [Impatiens glandulifera]